MGSHLTEVLVILGAHVHAFMRAASSGLNNISRLRPLISVHWAISPTGHSIDLVVRRLREAEDLPYVFHLGAQASRGRVVAPPLRNGRGEHGSNAEPAPVDVDHELQLEKLDTAGTSEQYGSAHEAVAHHHDFDERGAPILHERSPVNPKSVYATAKVAAGFLTMNYHDAYGVPGLVTRMFNRHAPAHPESTRSRPAARLQLALHPTV